MNDQTVLDLAGEGGGSDDDLALATYAQRAYLEYALSVVKGRALPEPLPVVMGLFSATGAAPGRDA